jgi:hypothetical protein
LSEGLRFKLNAPSLDLSLCFASVSSFVFCKVAAACSSAFLAVTTPGIVVAVV